LIEKGTRERERERVRDDVKKIMEEKSNMVGKSLLSFSVDDKESREILRYLNVW
jgi:hypothetical protein